MKNVDRWRDYKQFHHIVLKTGAGDAVWNGEKVEWLDGSRRSVMSTRVFSVPPSFADL
jgi:hypothetical protein